MHFKLPAKLSHIAGGVAAGLLMWAGPADSQSLSDALAAAYQNNPGLLAARAALRSDDEAVPQALANWRPRVELSGDVARTNTHLNTRTANRDQLRSPRGTSLDVTQPLFRGMRTVAGVRKAELDVKSARADLLASEQDVLLSAATAFMAVVRDQAVLDLNIKNEQVLRRQLEATQDRFRVGEITRTDVSQAEARVSGASADRIQAEGNLNNSRANYLNVIGEAPGNLASPATIGKLPASLANAISTALKSHPDVVSKIFSERAARANIVSVRGELLPSLNLLGKLSRAWESSTNDSQLTTGRVMLDLTVPLYQKGSVYSRLRAAKQDAGQSLLNLEDSRRDAQEAAAKAWETHETAKARIKSISAQIKAAEIALEGVQREAAVGSRTVLDVLDAEQELLDAKVSLVRANRDQIVASFELQESIGGLTAKNLGLPVKIYDPTLHYKEIRSKWFGSNSSGQGPDGTKK
ncbi:MAG: TolC family outer membrane protein [Rhodospirillaceae bacterium]|nr:TolC family outer membrane protein [Rhodospirillaceae bacterium]MBT5940369.1 TolC family outer membrane protein [Rhodospirillaceae bacterium]MBT7954103.1 TolC family outer membrane protein [Rhodospirillaceae bacterium]